MMKKINNKSKNNNKNSKLLKKGIKLQSINFWELVDNLKLRKAKRKLHQRNKKAKMSKKIMKK